MMPIEAARRPRPLFLEALHLSSGSLSAHRKDWREQSRQGPGYHTGPDPISRDPSQHLHIERRVRLGRKSLPEVPLSPWRTLGIGARPSHRILRSRVRPVVRCWRSSRGPGRRNGGRRRPCRRSSMRARGRGRIFRLRLRTRRSRLGRLGRRRLRLRGLWRQSIITCAG